MGFRSIYLQHTCETFTHYLNYNTIIVNILQQHKKRSAAFSASASKSNGDIWGNTMELAAFAASSSRSGNSGGWIGSPGNAGGGSTGAGTIGSVLEPG